MAQTKNINMTPDIIMPTIKLSQYDVGRVITLNLKDGSGAYAIPDGATVKLVGTKPSGLGFTVTASTLGAVATITTTAEMTDECGIAVAELTVEKSGLKIGSTNIRIDVERSPHPEGTTDGSAEQIIPALTLLLREIEEDIEQAEADIQTMEGLKDETESNALKAEGWATGKQDGTDVGSGSPYYHNSSKYYSEQASAKATEASNSAGSALGAKNDAVDAKTAAQAAQAGAEAAEQRATVIVAGCITIDAETSELIIYE